MRKFEFPPKDEWKSLMSRPLEENAEIGEIVAKILKKVKKKGDKALFKYALKFEKAELNTLGVSENEIKQAASQISEELKKAINIAKGNIEKFHQSQAYQEAVVETFPGVQCWRKSVAIEKIGLYIPGGTAPLFSSVLMLGIPAKIAGCRDIVMCTPAGADGSVHPAILYTASLLGISKICKVGGAQAIAAMAYGTESVPQVYKIFGPGNGFVTKAKQAVSLTGTAIDMPAGPSELLVWADESANPLFVAADLLSQAEHGKDSQVILISNSASFLKKVEEEINEQLEVLPRKEIAAEALKNSVMLVLEKAEALEFINEYAPEHLIISGENPELHLEKIYNAGSVFLGNYAAESFGDYASGTNHTLPTSGFAKAYSGVSLDSFVKKITYQKISREALVELGPVVETMAEAEQLQAHKNAISIRLKNVLKNV